MVSKDILLYFTVMNDRVHAYSFNLIETIFFLNTSNMLFYTIWSPFYI